MSANTPDMRGKASEITDQKLLFERIGYRTFLAWRDGPAAPPLYDGFNLAELRRLQQLRQKSQP
jgi:hypothetical protein